MNRRFRLSRRDLASTEQQLASLYFDTAQLKLWKEKEIAELEAARARDRELLASVQRDLMGANKRIARLSNELQSMSESRSWRVTRPLRALSALFKPPPAHEFPESGATATEDHTAVVAASGPTLVPAVSHDAQTLKPLSEASSHAHAPANYLWGGKEAWDLYGRNRLTDFLASRERIVFPPDPNPKLTIILVLYNNAHLSLLSLFSVKDNAFTSYEVVIVENGSSDLTSVLLDRLDNATIIRNGANQGFSPACMQGAAQSKGEYLCFLNNDALLEPNCLQPAIKDLDDDRTIGAVGGRILFADGRLQEAGRHTVVRWHNQQLWTRG